MTNASAKLGLIKKIKNEGYSVQHIIHRHGLDEATALHVEAALIEAYPNLTNLVAGHGADQWGAAHTQDIVARYQAPWAEFDSDHRILLVGVSRTIKERGAYSAARFAWPLSMARAGQVQYVLAICDGLIVAAFEPTKWKAANTENFPEFGEDLRNRVAFDGQPAAEEIIKRYVGRRLPAGLQLAQAGVRYVGVYRRAVTVGPPL